jgi:hypothetical protein
MIRKLDEYDKILERARCSYEPTLLLKLTPQSAQTSRVNLVVNRFNSIMRGDIATQQVIVLALPT